MGSCILSRSFSLGDSDAGEGKNGGDSDTDMTEAMDVDEAPSSSSRAQAPTSMIDDDGIEEDDDDDDDDENDSSDVAMVPLADMLNARHGANNARRFLSESIVPFR